MLTFEWRSRTAFWESEKKRSKLFKSKFAHRKLLKKWFWSYLKLKHESSELLKSAFFSCLQTFEWRSRAAFGKVRQSVHNYLNQNLLIGSFLENGFKATLNSKTNVLSVWKGHFSVFCKVLSEEVETVFWESETMLRNLCWEVLESAFQSFLSALVYEYWFIYNLLSMASFLYDSGDGK